MHIWCTLNSFIIHLISHLVGLAVFLLGALRSLLPLALLMGIVVPVAVSPLILFGDIFCRALSIRGGVGCCGVGCRLIGLCEVCLGLFELRKCERNTRKMRFAIRSIVKRKCHLNLMWAWIHAFQQMHTYKYYIHIYISTHRERERQADRQTDTLGRAL